MFSQQNGPELEFKRVNSDSLPHAGNFEFDRKQSVLRLSSEAAGLLGVENGNHSVSLDEFLRLIFVTDRKPVESALQCIDQNTSVIEVKLRTVGRTGLARWLLLQVNGNQRHDVRSGIVTDISREFALASAAESAQQALTRSEQRFALVIEASHDGVWEWDLLSNRLYASPRLLELSGLAVADLEPVAEMIPNLVHGRERRKLLSAVMRHLADHRPMDLEIRLYVGDSKKSWRWFRLRGLAIRDAQGRALRIAGSLSDIHARKMAESAVTKNQAELVTLNAQLRELSKRLLGAQEEQRRRLAHELHDEIGQSLTAAIIGLETGKHSGIPTDLYQELSSVLNLVLTQVRDLSVSLRPSMLDQLGLEAALIWHLDRQSVTGKFDYELDVSGLDQRPDGNIELSAFRVVQEAVNNTVRHAKAAIVQVRVFVKGQQLHVEIEDDGRGFDAGSAMLRAEGGESFGLISMQERASLLGGSCDLKSVPGKGTHVHAVFPLF